MRVIGCKAFLEIDNQLTGRTLWENIKKNKIDRFDTIFCFTKRHHRCMLFSYKC